MLKKGDKVFLNEKMSLEYPLLSGRLLVVMFIDNEREVVVSYNNIKYIFDEAELVSYEIVKAEAEQISKEIMDDINEKAKKYSMIEEILWMSTGMIDDGNSIRFIINPEETLRAIVNVITDANIETSEDMYKKFMAKKKDAINKRLGEW